MRPFAAQIDLDIPRTFPENPLYHGVGAGGGGRAAVRNVLLAYAAEHPETGYCQGMNYVAAFLWLAVSRGEPQEDAEGNETGEKKASDEETEETTYWLFSCLVDDVMAPEIFARDMRGTLREFRTLSLLLRSKTPQTHAHLLKHDMDLCMLQSKWLLCVFTDSFPAETTARVLDVVFAEGHKAWLRVCVAMMVAHGDAIRKAAHVPDAMAILKRAFAEQHDADALLKAAHSRRWVGAFSRQVVAKARTSAVAQLRREAEAAAKARAARESKNARRIGEGNKKGAGGGEEAERAVSAGEKAKNDDEKKR